MRKLLAAFLALTLGANGPSSAASFALFQTGSAASYSGFLDTYSSAPATWGWASYKLKAAYGGDFAIIERQSDSTTTNIGFDSSGKANVSTFNTFCANTNCFVSTLYDQVNGINATQATQADMPRIIVGSNNLLAICPAPGSKMTTSYSSTVNTAAQEMFAIAQPETIDSNWSSPNLPGVAVTANVTSGSNSIAAMSSQVGISTTNQNPQAPGLPGVTDSSAFLPVATYLSALPSGSTGTLANAVGTATPTGSKTGDTLAFTNAVFGGVWLMNGPSSATFESSAYWGFGLGLVPDYPSDLFMVRNTSNNLAQNVVGQGIRSQWGVWDIDSSTEKLFYNGVQLTAGGSATNITYSTNVGMTLFSNASGSENAQNNCFEGMVLMSATQASRVAMAGTLETQFGISFPFASATSDGFTMTGEYQPNGSPATSSVYGSVTVGPDANGMTWNNQSGGYTWPSIAYANNINNSTTLYRFVIHAGDSDTNITAAERSEMNVTTQTAPGDSWSEFYQFEYEALPDQTGSWCYGGQVHYNDAIATAPDLLTFSCLNNQVQFVTQKGSGPTTTNCGSAQTLTVGVTYAVVVTAFWSTNHTSDTLEVWFGQNGTSLSAVCNTSGSLWDNDTGAYMKIGNYRGFPWNNGSGSLTVRYMNPQFAPTTANAYAAYITSQPALPTHP